MGLEVLYALVFHEDAYWHYELMTALNLLKRLVTPSITFLTRPSLLLLRKPLELGISLMETVHQPQEMSTQRTSRLAISLLPVKLWSWQASSAAAFYRTTETTDYWVLLGLVSTQYNQRASRHLLRIWLRRSWSNWWVIGFFFVMKLDDKNWRCLDIACVHRQAYSRRWTWILFLWVYRRKCDNWNVGLYPSGQVSLRLAPLSDSHRNLKWRTQFPRILASRVWELYR